MSGPRRLVHLTAATRARVWLDMAQLAVHGHFPTPEAARKFVTRHRADLVTGRTGRRLLVDQPSFDRYIERTAMKRTA